MSTQFAEPAKSLSEVTLPGRLNYYADIDPNQSAGASAAIGWMQKYRKEAGYTNKLRVNADPRITRAAHLSNVENHIRKLDADSTRHRGQRLTRDSLVDSRLLFGGGVGRADRGFG